MQCFFKVNAMKKERRLPSKFPTIRSSDIGTFKFHHFSTYELQDLRENVRFNEPVRNELFRILLVKKGGLSFKLNRKELNVAANQLCIFPPSTLIEISSILPESEAIGTVFSPDFFLNHGLHYKHPKILELFVPDPSPIMSVGGEELNTLDWLMKRLRRLSNSTPNHLFQEEILINTFTQFIYELGNIHQGNKVIMQTRVHRKQNLVLLFFKEISKYYKQERSVQFYANLLFITRKYLSKTVKQVTGKTPSFFIDEAVATEAKMLLSDPRLTINEIAQSLNFTDQSTFGKFFKKQVGLAPTSFRI